MRQKHWPWMLLAAAACRPPASGVVPLDGDPCHVSGDSGALDTVTIGFSQLEDDAERYRLRLTGDPGIWTDCLGRTRTDLAPRATSSIPVLRIQVHRQETDERDLLDLPRGGSPGTVDLMITRNPDVIAYARNKPGFRVVALPWDRTYVMVAPVPLSALGFGDEAALRNSLSRDVVSAESRPVQLPFWWETASCPGTMPTRPMGRLPQVVYPQGDRTAREPAERLVAIHSNSLRAVGLPPDAFNGSLAGGDALMYVLPLSRFPGDCSRYPQWPSAAFLVPLVDTRADLVARSGVPPFTIESDGVIRFDLVLPVVPSDRPAP